MLTLKSSPEIALALAKRIRERRLRRGWTQAEIARRAGVRPATYVLFERTGQIAFLRLLKVLDILELADEVDRIARGEDLFGMSLDQLTQRQRQRGSRKSA
jgi:transcriptional regulator with XRE-family HTH domain